MNPDDRLIDGDRIAVPPARPMSPFVTLNEYLKTGLGRNMPAMPAIVKNDPWWLDPKDPHRAPYVRQGLFGPTVPTFWTSNPAYAQVQNEHVRQMAWSEIIQDRATPQAAAEKAFKWVEENLREIPDRTGLSPSRDGNQTRPR